MIYRVVGKLIAKKENFIVIEAGGGISFKIFVSAGTLEGIAIDGEPVELFTHLHTREDALELYGFLNTKELDLFEKLNDVSGIGPKSALGVLGIANIDNLIATINEGKTELLTRSSGVGKRTAERIILELKGKLASIGAPELITLMESDVELEETLVSFGYTRTQAKTTINNLDPNIKGFKERLKAALKGAQK